MLLLSFLFFFLSFLLRSRKQPERIRMRESKLNDITKEEEGEAKESAKQEDCTEPLRKSTSSLSSLVSFFLMLLIGSLLESKLNPHAALEP